MEVSDIGGYCCDEVLTVAPGSAADPVSKKHRGAITGMMVSLIIPTHNRRESLRRCLAGTMRQDYPEYEVIVVDDGSTDGTREMVETEFPQVRYVGQPNRGPAAARNTGIRLAGGEILAFTDDDCVPPPDWLRAHLAYYQDPLVGAVGGPQIPVGPSYYDLFQMAHYPGDFSESVRRISRISGWEGLASCNLSIRREVFDRVGLFDEAFVTGADPELTRRANRLGGYTLVYDPTLRVDHLKVHTFTSYLRMRFHRGCGSVLTDIKEGTLSFRRFVPVVNVVRAWRNWRHFQALFGGGPANLLQFWSLAVVSRWAEVLGRAYYYWKVGRNYESDNHP
jgi:GT2 family glycosyltransferase